MLFLFFLAPISESCSEQASGPEELDDDSDDDDSDYDYGGAPRRRTTNKRTSIRGGTPARTTRKMFTRSVATTTKLSGKTTKPATRKIIEYSDYDYSEEVKATTKKVIPGQTTKKLPVPLTTNKGMISVFELLVLKYIFKIMKTQNYINVPMYCEHSTTKGLYIAKFPKKFV